MRKPSKLFLDFISSLSVEVHKNLSRILALPGGFGLLSILFVILGLSLVAGTATMGIQWFDEEARFQESKKTMDRLAQVISKTSPSENNYLRRYEEDLGKLPTGLSDLLSKPVLEPVCSMNTVTQKLQGWCGPYWTIAMEGESSFIDAWKRTLVYNPLLREVRSTGSNGIDENGSGDDLVTKF